MLSVRNPGNELHKTLIKSGAFFTIFALFMLKIDQHATKPSPPTMF